MPATQRKVGPCPLASAQLFTRAWPGAGVVLQLVASSLALWLTACGGDGGGSADVEAPDVESDAGVPRDAGLRVKVLNVGDSCSLLAHGSCRGDAAQCLEISYSGAFYTGGYCTADCRSSIECGPDAECPVADAEQLEPGYAFRSTWARKCFKSCSPSEPDSCRFGYACISLAEAYLAEDAPAPLHRNVCIPRAPSFGDLHGDGGAD